MKVAGLEKWRHVVGFPGYLVSTWGRVYSSRSRKCLKPQPAGSGHFRVALRKDGATSLRLVHRLVLIAFVGPCPPGLECLHHDDNPSNNRLGNLRWGTRSENTRDAIRNRRARGGRQVGAALTRAQVRRIKRHLAANAPRGRIASAFGVSRTTIGKIADGTLWRDVVA